MPVFGSLEIYKFWWSIFLVLVINAENAAYKSEKFTTMAKRTRYGYLEDLAQNHVSAQTLETPNKFG